MVFVFLVQGMLWKRRIERLLELEYQEICCGFFQKQLYGLGQKSGSIDGNVKKAGAGVGGFFFLNKELYVFNDCWEVKI